MTNDPPSRASPTRPILLALLIAVTLGGAGCSASTSGPVTTVVGQKPATSGVNVDVTATPTGWVPVDYGDAQISVPPTWGLITEGAEACGPWSGVVILGGGQWCPPAMNVHEPQPPTVAIRTVPHPNVGDEGPPSYINGLAVYAPGLPQLYIVPALHIAMTFTGQPPAQVLRSLTYSPRATVLASGPAPTVPSGWHWITYGGIRFAAPSAWRVQHVSNAPACGTDVVLPVGGVVLAAAPELPISCPAPLALMRPEPQVAGIEVDAFQASGTLPPPRTQCQGPTMVDRLEVCIQTDPAYSALVVQVWTTGLARLTVKIGLSGTGMTDRIVLHSIRQAS